MVVIGVVSLLLFRLIMAILWKKNANNANYLAEAVLETMRRIKPMLDQFKNNSGFIGPPGPPGPKGDPAPLPSGPISKSYYLKPSAFLIGIQIKFLSKIKCLKTSDAIYLHFQPKF